MTPLRKIVIIFYVYSYGLEDNVKTVMLDAARIHKMTRLIGCQTFRNPAFRTQRLLKGLRFGTPG